MLTLVPESIDRYIEKHFPKNEIVLAEMQRYGENRKFPFIGPQVGRLLFMLTRMIKARRVLEIGSGFGYSAYWFARALSPSGKVIQTEYSADNSAKAREFFASAGLTKKAEFLTGDGLEMLEKVKGTVDIVLLDLDKKSYCAAFNKVKSRIRKGGLLIADNTLWSGRVADPADKDESTQGIRKFNEMLFSDRDFFATILPVRDGVAIGYKLD